MTIDELQGKVSKLNQIFNTPEAKQLIEEIEAVADAQLTADFTAKGEEAVRALGFQNGIRFVPLIPKFYETKLREMQAAESAQTRAKLGIK